MGFKRLSWITNATVFTGFSRFFRLKKLSQIIDMPVCLGVFNIYEEPQTWHCSQQNEK